MKPRVLILAGYGLNCDEETKFAFETSGANVDIIHINDIIEKIYRLDNYQILVFQGGFSYGDDTGAGNAYAVKVRNHIWDQIVKFINKDKLVIGICNGFQILVNLGLLPGFCKNYGRREIALIHNDSARYTVRFVDLRVENKSPWLYGIKKISLPIAHGEGKFYAKDTVIGKLKKENMIALRYIKGEMCEWLDLQANPNGSMENIAGITDPTGRIFGLMPHPERAQFFHQMPNWINIKETCIRRGKTIQDKGPGIMIFQNAVDYFAI